MDKTIIEDVIEKKKLTSGIFSCARGIGKTTTAINMLKNQDDAILVVSSLNHAKHIMRKHPELSNRIMSLEHVKGQHGTLIIDEPDDIKNKELLTENISIFKETCNGVFVFGTPNPKDSFIHNLSMEFPEISYIISNPYLSRREQTKRLEEFGVDYFNTTILGVPTN